MWTERDRNELAVWADELQLRGEPLGELVATSLAIEHHQRTGWDETALNRIRDRLAELERAVLEPMVEEFREFKLIWSHGMIVGLRIAGETPGRKLLDLLRMPVTRFLRTVEVHDPNSTLGHLHLQLGHPNVVARPWWIAFGPLPRANLSCKTVDELDFGARLVVKMLENNAELRELWIAGTHVALPWTDRVDPEVRLYACEQLCAREHFDDASLTTLTRALWDTDPRVRMLVLDVLPRLGVDAAPMIPSLLCVDATELRWSRKIRQVLAVLARDPELVAAVARNFTIAQSRCALWLSELPLPIARQATEPRVEAMLTGPQRATGSEHDLLVEAHRRLREPPPLPIPRPLRRLKRWIDGTWP